MHNASQTRAGLIAPCLVDSLCHGEDGQPHSAPKGQPCCCPAASLRAEFLEAHSQEAVRRSSQPCLDVLPQEKAEVPKLAEAQAAPKGGDVKMFTMEEVEKHDTRESAWFVHAGQVGISPALQTSGDQSAIRMCQGGVFQGSGTDPSVMHVVSFLALGVPSAACKLEGGSLH